MALEPTMKYAVRRIAEAFRAYAAAQEWRHDEYRILVEVNKDWGRIHVVFVAPRFQGVHPEDNWRSVIEFLDSFLINEPKLLESMNLTLRTFDQVQRGGLYSLSPNYVDADELIATPTIG
jgi:hypothetical protein